MRWLCEEGAARVAYLHPATPHVRTRYSSITSVSVCTANSFSTENDR